MADETPQPAAEVLSSAEPATASAPVGELSAQPVLHADGRRTGARVVPYDFRNPSFLSEVELRRLRLLHEDFVSYLGARLSLYLRMEFGLKLSALTTVTYAKFTETLANPTHLTLFKAEPLTGVGLLDVTPRLALALADRLLGGRGLSGKAQRPLTEIEIALLEDVVGILLEEWCGLWKPESDLRIVVLGHENSGRFLQTSPKDAVILALKLEATFGDCAETIQIGVPYYTIEPAVKKIQDRRQTEAATAATDRRPPWQPAYDLVSLPVRAEWSYLELTLRELASLRVGDVLEMPASLFHETRVLLNGTPKFIGSVGHDADRVAVQLTRQLPLEETTHAHSNDGRKDP
ncbi:MAG: FliM/FliN family flagellar motor switch protein [Opitutaceae bacterium]